MKKSSEHGHDIQSVVAVPSAAYAYGPLRAVMLKKSYDSYRLVWKKTAGADENFGSFANRVFAPQPCGSECDTATANVIGMDTSNVAFYRIEIPPVKEKQVASIINMQAETLLPLPLEQMSIAWNMDSLRDGKHPVMIAAAKSDQLQSFVAELEDSQPSQILLNCQGTAKAFTELFGSDEKEFVIVNICPAITEVILIRDGSFAHAVTLDMGSRDFDAEEQHYTGDGLFIHDIRDALEVFGCAADTRTYVVSESDGANGELILHMRSEGIMAECAVLSGDRLGSDISSAQICQYLAAIGLGMLVIDGDDDSLNLFEDIYTPRNIQDKTESLGSLRKPAVIAACMIVLSLFVFKAVDKANLATLEATDFSDVIARRDTQELIARQRPDMLDVFTKINESCPKGMMLDGFTFQRNSPVSISSTIKDRDKLYKLQQDIDSKKGISNVQIKSQLLDEKKKQINFKMTFDYKNFTKKR